MNNLEYTKLYYSIWLDISSAELDQKGVTLIKTDKRKICPDGHPGNLDIYCVSFQDSFFISYNPDLDDTMDLGTCLKTMADCNEAISQLDELFGERLKHRRAHYFTQLAENIDISEVVMLKNQDYPYYKELFTKQYPHNSPDGWMDEYFDELVKDKLCYGIFKDGMLVSVTDSPTVPFLSHKITEPGINALENYGRKGYAKAVCAAYIKHAISDEKVPIWTGWNTNYASIKLAESLGFVKFCELYTVEGDVRHV